VSLYILVDVLVVGFIANFVRAVDERFHEPQPATRTAADKDEPRFTRTGEPARAGARTTETTRRR